MTMDADIIPLTKHTDSVAVLWATPSFEEVELPFQSFTGLKAFVAKLQLRYQEGLKLEGEDILVQFLKA